MFSTKCATTAALSEPARAGDRHTVPARSPSVGGIPSRAIGLPGTMFATFGVSPAGHLAQILITLVLSYKHSPRPNLHSTFTKNLVYCLINLFLNYLLTPTARTLHPYRQRNSTPLILKYSWWTMDRGLWHCIGDRNQDHAQEKEMQKRKMAIWGGLTNNYEKKRSKKQRRKGKTPIWMQSSKEYQEEIREPSSAINAKN